MPAAAYDLRVLGLNLAASEEPQSLSLSRGEVARMLKGIAASHPPVEAVVVRARNHIEAFLAAPHGTCAVRAWLEQLRHVRPDLLDARRRPLYYHLRGESAQLHLRRLASGRYAPKTDAAAVQAGVKAALGLAARYGTLGETLDGLFVQALHAAPAPSAFAVRPSSTSAVADAPS